MTEETWEGEGGRVLNPDELDELITDGEPVSPVQAAPPLEIDPNVPPPPIPFRVTVYIDGDSFEGDAPGSAFYTPVGVFVHGAWGGSLADVDREDRLFPFGSIHSIKFHTDEFREALEEDDAETA